MKQKTNVEWTDEVLDKVTAPTRPGFTFKGWKHGETDVTTSTTYESLAKVDTLKSITLIAQWEDITPPTISGIENGKTYCKTQTVTVSDNEGIASVTLNGKPVTPTDGKFTVPPATEAQTIIVTDNAGNTTKMTITVNDGHTYEWQNKDGQY